MDKKDIKNKIKELQKKLKIIEDSDKIEEIKTQIGILEEQIKSPIWKKIVKWITISSMIAGLIYTVLEIVTIFL